MKATLERVVLQEHVFVERGRPRRRTILELLVMAVRDHGITGKPKAASLLHDLVLRFGPQEGPEQAYIFMPEPPSAGEQEDEAERVKRMEEQRAAAWQPKQKKR